MTRQLQNKDSWQQIGKNLPVSEKAWVDLQQGNDGPGSKLKDEMHQNTLCWNCHGTHKKPTEEIWCTNGSVKKGAEPSQ